MRFENVFFLFQTSHHSKNLMFAGRQTMSFVQRSVQVWRKYWIFTKIPNQGYLVVWFVRSGWLVVCRRCLMRFRIELLQFQGIQLTPQFTHGLHVHVNKACNWKLGKRKLFGIEKSRKNPNIVFSLQLVLKHVLVWHFFVQGWFQFQILFIHVV